MFSLNKLITIKDLHGREHIIPESSILEFKKREKGEDRFNRVQYEYSIILIGGEQILISNTTYNDFLLKSTRIGDKF